MRQSRSSSCNPNKFAFRSSAFARLHGTSLRAKSVDHRRGAARVGAPSVYICLTWNVSAPLTSVQGHRYSIHPLDGPGPFLSALVPYVGSRRTLVGTP